MVTIKFIDASPDSYFESEPAMSKTRLSLAPFARRIAIRATSHKRALATQQRALLTQIADAVQRSPGAACRALLAGPPGSGKSIAAQVLARELQRPLYRVDPASVVSKYIGETEKNLNALFASAKTINAILFFDEADALFAKRTEVRDSHDRYSKAQISHVLNAVNHYNGLVLAAAREKRNLDTAFTRRLQHVMEFT